MQNPLGDTLCLAPASPSRKAGSVLDTAPDFPALRRYNNPSPRSLPPAGSPCRRLKLKQRTARQLATCAELDFGVDDGDFADVGIRDVDFVRDGVYVQTKNVPTRLYCGCLVCEAIDYADSFAFRHAPRALFLSFCREFLAKRGEERHARLNCRCGAPSGGPITKLSLAVFPFLVPGHLNSLQSAFVRLLRIAPKSRQFRNPFMHIGEPNRQRIQVRKFVR